MRCIFSKYLQCNCIDLQDGRIDYGEFAAMMRKGGDHGSTIGRNRTASRNLNFNLADAFGIKESS